MDLKSVLPLFAVFLLLGFQQVISTSPTTTGGHGECGPLVANNLNLKEMIQILEQKDLDRELENKELKRILHHTTDNSQLSKAVEDLRSTIVQQNIHLDNIDDFITKTIGSQKIANENLLKIALNEEKQVEEKVRSQILIENLKRKIQHLEENLEIIQRKSEKGKDECIAEQNNLRNKIEQLLRDKKEEREIGKTRQTKMETKLNRELENLKENLGNQKTNLEKAMSNLESKSKQLDEYQTKENVYKNKIQDFKSQVAFLKEKLEKSQDQLDDSNHLVESHSLQLNQTEKNLIECLEKIPKTGCKGLSSGIHKIEIPGLDPFFALCNGDIEGGGWIVTHNRFNGSLDFNKTWTEYRIGFGDLKGEFFIGLKNLHLITHSQIYELYVQLGYFDGRFQFTSYDSFRIGNENTNYELESLGEFRGTALNRMPYNLNQPFSTFDHENDQMPDNCAGKHGPWWHKDCGWIRLNAKYFKSEVVNCSSMSLGNCISLKSARMLIRPK